jgi:predicted enzyme related to lactoylglutathione lyase
VDNLPTYARFECPEGGATFSVHRTLNVVQDSGVIVYFECTDLDAVVARLQARWVIFDSQPKDQPWLWREAYLRDPDGNLICLYHAGVNRRTPPWRLSSQH